VPGSLARITALVAEAGANVQEIHHQRAFTLLAAQHVDIHMVLQTRDAAHVQELLARLNAEGLHARLVPQH
jgi:threonine dehydratase